MKNWKKTQNCFSQYFQFSQLVHKNKYFLKRNCENSCDVIWIGKRSFGPFSLYESFKKIAVHFIAKFSRKFSTLNCEMPEKCRQIAFKFYLENVHFQTLNTLLHFHENFPFPLSFLNLFYEFSHKTFTKCSRVFSINTRSLSNFSLK